MSDYGTLRKQELKHIDELLKNDKYYSKKLTEIYESASEDIQKEIIYELEFLTHSLNNKISMQMARETIREFDVRKYEKEAERIVREARERANSTRPKTKIKYSDYSDEVNDNLRKYNVTMRTNRLELLQARINMATTDMSAKEISLLDDRLVNEMVEELERQAGLLGQTVPSINKTREYIEALLKGDETGVRFSDRIWANQEELTSELNNMLRRTILKGENPKKASKDLRSFVKKSILGDKNKAGAKFYAERIAITESSRVQALAQKISFDEMDIDKYMFIAENDSKTCSVCRSLDGEVFRVEDMESYKNANPMHPFCRCSTRAVIDLRSYK